MQSLRQYILTVVVSTMICKLVLAFAENTTAKKTIRILCNLLLAAVVLKPLTNINLDHMFSDWFDQGIKSELYMEEGKHLSQTAMAEYIKAQSEAYILDKAQALGADDLEVNISLTGGDPPIPYLVYISGNVSPYAKLRIEQILTDDLGITKENQIWNDP